MVTIIDGNQLACRCYFSLDKLTTINGKRTETIYGFLGSFRKIVRTYKDSTFFLTWDGGNERRKAIYPQYKAGRKKFEDAFYEQLGELRKIISCLGIKQYHFSQVEADDLIGTLTVKSRKKGQKILIVSSDHDFEQLITRHVKVLHPLGNNIIKDEQFVLDNYGIAPDRLVEVMAITGDSTDNIPGIETVGDKTASRLILANGSLDNILRNIDSLKIYNRAGKVVPVKDDLREKIRAGSDGIRIALKLVTINCDLDVEPDFSDQQTDFDSLLEIFKKLEFNQFSDEIETWRKIFIKK